ncbi:histidine triad nucleotide-binding protein [Legionella impletisoli]|uniref:Histidine triad nucleotide-binding protein n=1 Tax=Legionella impletisoli TaxID=343510 RepID=A0A917NBC5_9GAMM|nr:histidine triad nucleotide-binding protein [Legionella impletisoli]GGI84076.1 histidine triad nucleotide-binding protein [Legionella impletisoli]
MSCLFCNIVNGELNTDKVYEDERLLAFRDINPKAPTHILIIPKKHIETINDATSEDESLLGHMVLTAKQIAAKEKLTQGYRLVFNVNSGGGQEVYHIHLHLLGGRQMTWPPG